MLPVRLILGCLLLTSRAFAFDTSYWIWAGISANDAPTNYQLYIYQGAVQGEGSKFFFSKKGIFPHPLKAEKIILVYRVQGARMDAENLGKLFLFHAQLWRRHEVSVSGLQIDHDVPTAKLKSYSIELTKIRKKLPKEYKLSITGLADWSMNASPDSLKALHMSVDEIVYQIYQTDSYVPEAEKYVRALEKNRYPYKLGLLMHKSPPFLIEDLKYRKGIVYFIQRKK